MSFDDAARNWDTPERTERAHALAARILHAIEGAENTAALEFGCGTGLLSFALRERFESIYCVDVSEGMLDVLRKKIENMGAGNLIPAGIGLLDKLGLFGAVDVIYSSMVFHHIVDVTAQLRALYPLLKPGGLLITIDLDREDGSFHSNEPDFHGHNGFDRPELAKWMQSCGFSDIRFETAYEGKRATSPIPFFCAGQKRNIR